MSYKNNPFTWRKRGQELQQRLRILGKSVNFFNFVGVDTRSCKIKGCDFVTSGFQQWLELVPTPRAMAKAVHQNKMLLLAHFLFFLIFFFSSALLCLFFPVY